MKNLTISIIGGAATGCAVLISLLREFSRNPMDKKVVIQVFEPNELGTGLAYGIKDNDLILNTSISSTSINSEDPLDFFKWLKINESKLKDEYPILNHYDENSFLPRSLVALYIKDTVAKWIEKTKTENIEIRFIKKKVLGVEYKASKSKFIISTETDAYFSHYCILATGYDNGLPDTYVNLKGTPHYYPSPYLCYDEIKKIPHDKRILIIGTRLTAIDTALILKDHQHITMASRSGYLPSVRNKLTLSAPKYLTAKQVNYFLEHNEHHTLSSIKQEIENELSLVYGRTFDISKIHVEPSAYEQLKKDIHIASHQLSLFEDSIMNIADFIGSTWNHFNAKEKQAFFNQFGKLIYRYFFAFPLINAQKIEDLIKSKHLKILSHLKHIEVSGNKFIAEFDIGEEHKLEEFDYVINATSAGDNLKNPQHILFQKLDEEQLIEFTKFGGIKVNNQFQIINPMTPNGIFYAAGPLIKGSVFATNLLLYSARHAKIIAQRILENIEKTEQCTQLVVFLGKRQLEAFSLSKIENRQNYRLIAIVSREDPLTLNEETKAQFDHIYRTKSVVNQFLRELDYHEVYDIIQEESLRYQPESLSIVSQDEAKVLLAGKLRDDFHVKTGARFCELIPFRNKVIMKDILVEQKIRVPHYLTLSSKSLDFEELKHKLGLPFIIKPISSAGSLDVFKISEKKQYNEFVKNNSENLDKFEAEEFIDGVLYHCDAVIQKKSIIFLECCRYSSPNLDFQSGTNLGSIILSEDQIERKRLKEFTTKVLEALGKPDGCYHMELFINKEDEIVFLEVGARAPGFIVTKVYEKSCGVNMLDLDLKIQAGIETRQENITLSPSFWLIFPTKQGIVKDLVLPQINSEYEIEWLVSKGDYTEACHSNVDLGGMLFACNPDYDSLMNDFNKLTHFNVIRYTHEKIRTDR